MTLALPAAILDPESALALVEPQRQEFALLFAAGGTKPADLMKIADIAPATYYRWIKDEKILAYVDAVGRDIGRFAKRALKQEVAGAIKNVVNAQTDYDMTPTMLKASLEILDRAGVTKEEITRANSGGGDTVVQVNLNIPINTNAYEEQQERRRRREAASAVEATFVENDDE